MEQRRSRFWVSLAALSLVGVIVLAMVELLTPVEKICIPEAAPYVPAELVYVSPSGEKYHRADCSAIASSKSLTELAPEDAVAQGYEPCMVCVP